MKHFLIFVAGLIVSSQSARAIDLPIRSGEHDEFSRLVFDLPSETTWSLDQTDREARLLIDIPDVRFLTGDVFTRMPRSRVTELAQEQAGEPLIMRLGCDCDISGFVVEGSRLVVDIVDPPLVPNVTFPLANDITPYRFDGVEDASPGAFGIVAGSFLTKLIETEHDKPQNSLVAEVAGAVLANGSAATGPLFLNAHDGIGGLKKSHARLQEQVGRAIDLGLLDPQSEHAAEKVEPDPVLQQPDSLAPSVQARISNPGLSVKTSFDRILSEAFEKFEPEQDLCFPADVVAIENWSAEESFSSSVAVGRARLFHEFDRLDDLAQIDLAKTYMHFGFGAEAISVLNLSAKPTPHHAIWIAMSKLLDDEPVSASENVFEGQHVCEGNSSLWAVLAAAELPERPNDDAVLRALSHLPGHLRVLLAPRLGKKYAAAGKSEVANDILKAGERILASADPAFGIVRAQVDLSENRTKLATQRLVDASQSGSEVSVHALIDLVDLKWSSKEPVSDEITQLVEAYSLEHRKGALGQQLRRSHALALALDGKFESSLSALAEVGMRDGLSAEAALYGLIMTLAAETAGDFTFLQIALNSGEESIKTISSQSAEKIAQRMFDLGLIGQAQSFLGRYEALTASPLPVALRAEIALASGRPDLALLLAGQASGVQADHLRARALMKKGDYSSAAAMFNKAGDTAGTGHSHWLEGTYASLEEDEESVYYQATELAKSLTEEPELPETPLAAGKHLVSDATATRNRVSELLDMFAVK